MASMTEPLDPREAFKPQSEHWGSMVAPVACICCDGTGWGGPFADEFGPAYVCSACGGKGDIFSLDKSTTAVLISIAGEAIPSNT